MLLGGSGSAALAAPIHGGTGTAAYGSAAREVAARGAAAPGPATARGPAAHGSPASYERTSYERAAGAPPERRTPGARTWLPAGASAGPSVEEHPCPVSVPSGTTCGYLLVPERRDVPNSRTIKVGYAVHHASGNASGNASG
ncbi:MAG: hypothetical protein IRZ07_07315, partial [Microbispora sp.]|nr:hypothetical protein [Microbispora sp.]